MTLDTNPRQFVCARLVIFFFPTLVLLAGDDALNIQRCVDCQVTPVSHLQLSPPAEQVPSSMQQCVGEGQRSPAEWMWLPAVPSELC